ncbi:MAG: VanZ family protein [Aphanocapsa sp. GSE-SYN-MK-11-07L]|jgi:VanZ family protein|nr:VanZ family protein [Aphanocapsa sp. GSE-SYN-MK-11-07L]
MKKPAISSAPLPWMLCTIGFMGILATILWFAYQGNLHPILTQNDKLAHLVLYGIAAFLGHQACNRRHIRQLGCSIPLFPALFGLFTLGEELVQQFSPYRSLDLLDVVASFAGIAIGYWLAERRWFSSSK